MSTLTVGVGAQYATIAAAVAAAHAGDTVAVQAGTYINDYAVVNAAISLVAVGGRVTMTNTAANPGAQALLTVQATTTVSGFSFSGMRNAAGTAAGVLVNGGSLTVQNSLFTANQNGLVAVANASTAIVIQGSEFAGNGNNDGVSHNVSVGAVKSLTITGSYLHDAAGGDELRSLAASTTVTDTRIEDNTAAAALSVDLPNGGAAVLQRDTIEKGANSSLATLVKFGGGTVQPGSSLSLTGNTVVSDKASGLLLQNQTTAIAGVSTNSVFGLGGLASGPSALSSNIAAPSRPAVSTTSLFGSLVQAVNYGRAGAVVASGHVLTVGAGQQYATLGGALAAATDGDTINVSAGVHLNDAVVVSHKVIIQGVGGIAQFVDTTAPANGLAQFVTTTDVTFKNIEVFGAANAGGTAAAILDQGGNLTIDNSTLHDNQAGVVVTASTAGSGSVGIFDSEIGANGSGGHNGDLTVGAVGSLTLQNDYLHGGLAGSEVSSIAENTVISGTRIVQGSGSAAAVSLADAGAATITGSAIERQAGAQAGPLVQVGGGTVYAGSTVTLTGNTLIADQTGTAATFVSNTAGAATLSASGTTFVGGAAGSVQVSSGSNTLASTATNETVATTSPWGASGPAATGALVVSGPAAGAPVQGQLIVAVSETAFQGDAQFTMLVDGTAVGGVLTATASHAAGQTQTFTIAGPYAPGPHTVALSFVNSLGSGASARALYVDGMTFNGQDMGQTAALTSNGTALLATGAVSTATTVKLALSETASQGDAKAFISIDGKVQGGVQTITASHAAGQEQALSFLVNLAPGAHTAAVTFLNDPLLGNAGWAAAVGSRDLFVDGMDVAGQHYANAVQDLGAAGTGVFAFNVAPPSVANGALFTTIGTPEPISLLHVH